MLSYIPSEFESLLKNVMSTWMSSHVAVDTPTSLQDVSSQPGMLSALSIQLTAFPCGVFLVSTCPHTSTGHLPSENTLLQLWPLKVVNDAEVLKCEMQEACGQALNANSQADESELVLGVPVALG